MLKRIFIQPNQGQPAGVNPRLGVIIYDQTGAPVNLANPDPDPLGTTFKQLCQTPADALHTAGRTTLAVAYTHSLVQLTTPQRLLARRGTPYIPDTVTLGLGLVMDKMPLVAQRAQQTGDGLRDGVARSGALGTLADEANKLEGAARRARQVTALVATRQHRMMMAWYQAQVADGSPLTDADKAALRAEFGEVLRIEQDYIDRRQLTQERLGKGTAQLRGDVGEEQLRAHVEDAMRRARDGEQLSPEMLDEIADYLDFSAADPGDDALPAVADETRRTQR